MKCDLNDTELEDMHLLFKRINQARAEIAAGISAQEDYAETINELNCLTTEDSEYGEELCKKALEQISLIRTAEAARFSIDNFRAELETKYYIPSGQCTGNENLS